MIVLSREELRDLTGYRQRSRVIQWLRENGFAFYLGGDEWPRVLRDTMSLPRKTLTRSAPNVQALKELQSGKAKEAQVRPA